jgi:hypothetical protein
VDGEYRKGWVFIGEYSKNLVCESLPDCWDTRKIKENRFKQFEPSYYPLSLRARDKFIIPILREVYRYNGLIEPIIFIRASVLIENLFSRSGRVITKFHEYGRSGIAPVHNPIRIVSYSVAGIGFVCSN